MKIKTIGWVLLLSCQLLLFFSTYQISTVSAAEKTETGISFEENIEPEPSQPTIEQPKPDEKIPSVGYLPHLGQMVTSFILLLLGVACLIIVLGVMSIKKIYSIHA